MRIFIAVLSVIVGFAGGWYFSPAKIVTGADHPEAKRAAVPARQKGDPGQVNPGPAGIREQLEQAFGSGRVGYTEMRELMLALGSMSSGNLAEFAGFFRDQSMEKSQIVLWQMFFSAWGEIDPEGAVAFIDERFESHSARRLFYASVIDTWKNDAIDEVLEFALKNFQSEAVAGADGEGSIDSHLAVDYLRSLVKTQPDEALALAMKLSDGEFVLELTARRISELAKQDRNSALEAIETLTGEAHVFAAAQFVIDWAKQEPSVAADWLVANFDERFGTHVLGQVAKSYATADPAAAIQWIEALPDRQTRAKILAEAVGAWAQVDPTAAASWLRDSAAISEHDPAVLALSHHLADSNPQEVIEQWVPRITDPQIGHELLAEVSSEWERSNPAEFSQWLEQTDAISTEVKQRLRARESPAGIGSGAPAGDAGQPDKVVAPAGIDQGRDR